MIIICPTCSKRYLVEDGSIDKSGRQVQCIACNHTWFFKPSPEAKELDQIHLDLIGAGSSVVNDNNGVNLGWLLLFITIFILGLGAFVARQPIMQFWPTSHIFYQTVGLGPATSQEGLRFDDLRPMIEPTEEGQRLLLTGTIINEGNEVREVDTLHVIVKGDCAQASWWERHINTYLRRQGQDQCRLDRWTYEPSESKIYPGEHVAFETSSARFFQGAKSIQVQF